MLRELAVGVIGVGMIGARVVGLATRRAEHARQLVAEVGLPLDLERGAP
jgi:hypothetical protein